MLDKHKQKNNQTIKNFGGNRFFSGTVETREFSAMNVKYSQMEGITFRNHERLWVTNEKYTRRLITIKSKLREFRITEPQIVNDPDTEPSFPEETDPTRIKGEKLNGQSVYPNPTHDSLTIQFAEPCRIEIFDEKGVVVLESNNENTGETTIDVSVLVPGNYLLKITTKSESREYKFIKI